MSTWPVCLLQSADHQIGHPLALENQIVQRTSA